MLSELASRESKLNTQGLTIDHFFQDVYEDVLAPDGWEWDHSTDSDGVLWRRAATTGDGISEFIHLSNLSPTHDDTVLGWGVGLRGAIIGEFERFLSLKVSYIETVIDRKSIQDLEGFFYLVSVQWLLLSDTTTSEILRSNVIRNDDSGRPWLDEHAFLVRYKRSLEHFSRFSSIHDIVELLSTPDVIKSKSTALGIICLDPTVCISLLYLSCGYPDEAIRLLEKAIKGDFVPTAEKDIECGFVSEHEMKTRAALCLQFAFEKGLVERHAEPRFPVS